MPNCPICLNLINKNRQFETLCCQQYFCLECINQWLNIKDNCPLCRSTIHKVNEFCMIDKINTLVQWFIFFFQLAIIFLGFLTEFNKK